MKKSTAKPYEGDNPYIFVSYCHKDHPFVFPIIESLARKGYRIWYDEGILPGSEWNEVIATRMSHSSLCVAFVSKNAAASHNCRREINYALLKNKRLLPVFLENTVLSPGMEMQLNANQYVFAYSYENMDKCFKSIMSVQEFESCLGEPDLSVEVRLPSFYEEAGQSDGAETIDISDEWFGIRKKISLPSKTEPVYVLTRKSTGEEILLNSEILYIGRNAEDGQNSYVIPGNLEIGRKHLVITQQDGIYYVTDRKSKNHTFKNGIELPPNEQIELKVGDNIRISSEIFTFHQKSTGGD